MERRDPRTSLDFWFPKLQASGVPVPRTEIVHTDVDLIQLMDGKAPDGFQRFLADLRVACEKVGFPAFLRTGHGSDKHGWKDTCYLKRAEDLPRHVANLVEWSCVVDLWGLPVDVWVAREFLPVEPAFLAFRGNMPVNRERRYFFRDRQVVSHVAYWDNLDAFAHHRKPDGWRAMLEEVNRETAEEVHELTEMTERVAAGFAGEGGWALDWLWTKRGWYATDMAEAHRAWGCPQVLELRRARGA